MATQPIPEELWTVREYLRTTWSPDREFVDGRIEERNLGEKDHSLIQRYLTFLFMLKRAEWAVQVLPELRTQTQPRRLRVPDVLVTRDGDTFERYVSRAPLIAIEILSPEDRLVAMQSKPRNTGTLECRTSGSSTRRGVLPIDSPERAWRK